MNNHPLPVIEEYEPVLPHSDHTPFCDDESCPCHTDGEVVREEIITPFFDGLLTADEAMRLFHGQQV